MTGNELEDCEDLQRVLSSTLTREELIDILLSEQEATSSRKVHLYFALTVALAEGDRRKRVVKARKLADIFLKPSSRYFINGVPPSVVRSVSRGRSHALQSVKHWLLQELSQNKAVREAVVRITAERYRSSGLSVQPY